MSTVGRKMAKGAAWSVLSRFIVRVLGIVSTLILARILIPEDFGLVVLATVCIGVLEVMGEFGLDTVLISSQDSNRSLYDTAWTFQVIKGVFLAVVIFFSADYIAIFMGDLRLSEILKWLALGALIQGFTNIGIVDFRKDLNLHKELQFQVIKKLASFVVTLILAYILNNYWALVAGIITGYIAGFILSYIMVKYKPVFCLSEWSAIFHFSKWLVYINILNYASSRADTLIIGSNTSTESVGYYGLASEISSLPTSELVFPIQRAIFPGFSKLNSDKEALKNSYMNVYALIVMLAAPLGVGISLVAEPLVSVLLGDKWLLTIPLIEILALAGVVRVMGASSGSILYALSKVKLVAIIGSIITFIRLVLLFWWVSLDGAEGAAWAMLLSTVVSTMLYIFVISKIINLPLIFMLSNIRRTIAALFIMTVCVLYADKIIDFYFASEAYFSLLTLVVLIAVGAVSYLISHLAFWKLSGKPDGPEKSVLDLYFKRFSK